MSSALNQGTPPVIEVRDRLRIARERAGFEQRDLADAMGVSRNTITNIEKGRTAIRKIVLNAWCMACGIPVDWALTGHTTSPDGDDGGQDGNEGLGLRIIRTTVRCAAAQAPLRIAG